MDIFTKNCTSSPVSSPFPLNNKLSLTICIPLVFGCSSWKVENGFTNEKTEKFSKTFSALRTLVETALNSQIKKTWQHFIDISACKNHPLMHLFCNFNSKQLKRGPDKRRRHPNRPGAAWERILYSRLLAVAFLRHFCQVSSESDTILLTRMGRK